MFQQEFREMIALLVNVLCAIVVISAIVFTLSLKNKVGVLVSEGYTTEDTMKMHFEFNVKTIAEITTIAHKTFTNNAIISLNSC